MEMINKYLIYVDLSFLIILIIFMLRGFIIGSKKMLVTSVVKWGLILLLIIFSGNIAEILLKTIKIKGLPVNDFLIDFITKEVSLTIEKGSYLETLIYALIKAAATLIVCYSSIIVVSIVIYPIISIILAILGIRKAAKSAPKTFISRSVGTLIGIAVSIIIFITCYMPIYGGLSLANSIEEDISMINTSTVEPRKELSVDASNENTSFILESLSNDYNICEQYIDNFFVISMNGSKVKIIKEYHNIRTLFPVISKLTNEKDNLKISEEDFNAIVDAVTGTELKEIAIPLTLEILYAKGTFEKNNIIITKEDIYDTNWKKEIDYFDNFLSSLKDTYKLYNKYIDNPKDMIGDEDFSKTFTNNFRLLFKITFINKYGPDLLNTLLEKSTEEIDDPTTKKALELIDFQQNLLDDLEVVFNSLYNIYHLGFINKDIKPDYTKEETKTVVRNLSKDIFSLSFVKGNENNLIEFIYETLELNKYADFSSIDLTKIDWEKEPENIANIIIEFTITIGDKELKDAEILEIFDDNNDNLIDAIASSEVIRYGLLPGLNGLIKEEINKTDFSEISDLINIPTDKETLKKDLKVFSKIIPLFEDESINILDDEEKLQSLLVDILSLSFIKGNEKELFDKLINNFELNDFIDTYGIILNYDIENWEEEGKALASVIYNANKIGTSDLNNINDIVTTKKQELKTLLIAIANSKLIQKSLPKIIDKSLTDMEFDDWKSNWLEQEKTTFHQNEWEEEIDNIIDILEMYQNANIDFNDIQPTDIQSTKQILDKMTELKSIKMDYLVTIINDKLKEEPNTTKTYLVIPTNMNWKQEINSLFDDNGVYKDIIEISPETTYRQYGKILDKLKNLQTLKDTYAEFITDYINNLDDFKNGNLTISLTEENIKKVTSFEDELSIIDEIDFTSETQNGELIDRLMASVLLREQTEIYIKEIIEKNDLDTYYNADENLSTDIDTVNQKIKSTKEDTDPTNDWSWAKEIEIIESFKTQLDDTISAPSKEKVESLKTTADKGIITTKALEKVLEKYPTLSLYLS